MSLKLWHQLHICALADQQDLLANITSSSERQVAVRRQAPARTTSLTTCCRYLDYLVFTWSPHKLGSKAGSSLFLEERT